MAELTTDKVLQVVGTTAQQMTTAMRRHGITHEQLMVIYLSLVAGFAGESGESREGFIGRATRAFDEVQAGADAEERRRRQQEGLER